MEPFVSEEEVEQFINDTITWLESASTSDTLDYLKALPDYFWQDNPELSQKVVDAIRYKRSNYLYNLFDTNAVLVLSETELLEMLSNLAEYNADSVFKNYQGIHPQLKYLPTAIDCSEWAKTTLRAWRNYFHLITGQTLLEDAVYLHSFLKAPSLLEKIAEIGEEADALVKEVATDLAQHNYQRHILSAELRFSLHSYFEQLVFLPPTYIDSLLTTDVTDELFSLCASLRTVTLFLSLLNLTPELLADRAKIEQLLWDELAFDQEVETIKKYELIRQRILIQIGENQNQPILEQIVNLITLEKINDGISEQTLRAYAATLDTQQKKTFWRYLRNILIGSPVIEALFEPIDVEHFLDQAEQQAYNGNKAEFVDQYQDRIIPELWITTRKAMMMIASLV